MIDALTLLPEASHEKFDSRHRLVIAASQRAKHLMQGARPVVPARFTKETAIAIDEVLHGHIEFLTDKEARQAIKDSKRGKDSEVERAVITESVEDSREIKKELSIFVDDSTKAEESEGEE